MCEYVELFSASGLSRLKGIRVNQYMQKKEFYKKLDKEQQKFWNKVKTFCSNNKVAVSYHPQKGKKKHFHILYNHTGAGRWTDISAIRGLRQTGPACRVKVWVKAVNRNAVSERNAMAYMFKTGKYFFGCTDLDFLRELRGVMNQSNMIDSQPECGGDDECPGFCSEDTEENIDNVTELEGEDNYSFFGLDSEAIPNQYKEVHLVDDTPMSNDPDAPLDDDSDAPLTSNKRKFDDGFDFAEIEPKKTKSMANCEKLSAIMDRWGETDRARLRAKVYMEGGDSEIQELATLNLSNNINNLYAESAALVKKNPKTYYESFMETSPGSYSTMSVEDTDMLFADWCEEQQVDRYRALLDIWLILSMKLPKKNVFCWYGVSNAGKTFWLEKCIGYLSQFVGKTTSQTDFMWGECVDSTLILVNELALLTKAQIDLFKEVAEGLEVKVAIKYRPNQTLSRKPVIMTSNEEPWSHCTGVDMRALQNRMVYERVNKESQVLKDHANDNPMTNPNPDFFKKVFEIFDKNIGENSDDVMFYFDSGLDRPLKDAIDNAMKPQPMIKVD